MHDMEREDGSTHVIYDDTLPPPVVYFKVYRISGFDPDIGPIYGNAMDNIYNYSLVKPDLEGSLKWDGCCDIIMNNSPVHFCGKDMLASFFREVTDYVYDKAKDFMENCDF
jgi:hypothetical protein